MDFVSVGLGKSLQTFEQGRNSINKPVNYFSLQGGPLFLEDWNLVSLRWVLLLW